MKKETKKRKQNKKLCANLKYVKRKNYARNSNFWNSKLLVNTYLFIYVQVCTMCEINERVRALGKLLLLFYLFVVEFEKYLNELNRSEPSQATKTQLNVNNPV